MLDPATSKPLLRAFVPLCQLSDEQLDWLLLHAELLHLYSGQNLLTLGDNSFEYVFLLHGRLQIEDVNGRKKDMISGDETSYQAIAHEFPRRATVTAVQDCTILKVNADFLEKLLCWGQVARCLLADIAANSSFADDYLWINKLLESRLFYKVPPTNIRAILNYFVEVKVVKGEQIIRQGDEGSCCYLIKKGSADIFIDDHGFEAVANISIGAVFGEDALVTNNVRNASVVMASDGILMKLEKQQFHDLLKPPAVTVVSPDNALELVASGAHLLDVRTEKEFDLGHYQAAINVPLHLSHLKSVLLDKQLQYIAYSSSEERACAAAFLLAEQGLNVMAMQGGMDTLAPQQRQLFNSLSA